MITIHELLEDPQYRKYFCTIPELPSVPRLAPPWRLYVKTEKAWLKKDCWEYLDAFKAFRKIKVNGVGDGKMLDAAIVSRALRFEPPSRIVRIKGKYHPKTGIQLTREVFWKPNLQDHPEDHRWCGYCRRPSTFAPFANHHAFRGSNAQLVDSTMPRCIICGIRRESAGLREWH